MTVFVGGGKGTYTWMEGLKHHKRMKNEEVGGEVSTDRTNFQGSLKVGVEDVKRRDYLELEEEDFLRDL